jgi:hypothetical protein
MPNVERSPVKPPNEMISKGDPGSSSSQSRMASPVKPPNDRLRDGDPGSSADLTRTKGKVHVDDHRFDLAKARMPQPESTSMPGRGDVPIDMRQYAQPATGMARQDTGKTSVT